MAQSFILATKASPHSRAGVRFLWKRCPGLRRFRAASWPGSGGDDSRWPAPSAVGHNNVPIRNAFARRRRSKPRRTCRSITVNIGNRAAGKLPGESVFNLLEQSAIRGPVSAPRQLHPGLCLRSYPAAEDSLCDAVQCQRGAGVLAQPHWYRQLRRVRVAPPVHPAHV